MDPRALLTGIFGTTIPSISHGTGYIQNLIGVSIIAQEFSSRYGFYYDHFLKM